MAQESFHTIKVKKLKSLILKLDLIKAYDHVNWDFLRLVLLQVVLSLDATNWFMGRVKSVDFVVLVNGEHTNFFKSLRGLRLGCPLSHYYFFYLWKV